ncbi:MAG: cation efflux system protein [Candidatus Methanoperedens nitroreducens]|uniref:Cation efflux system protein n=1 Tax=Candidatus Methanoperedens nitratireducens TaxID=1392998 RepID=A0A0P8AD94_9EURY|nr:cation diffusion facilitator family transporter [Candidatus Methanoperedens sp. BLZ2]KAB2944557.1 MAG: cation transporter [Candidatus Methanoperedens sp.]KPQ44811.1 MAG: cation efflux system protein [Candidatus Methanoperedens sp. BLZ1]MBZ0176821.1 cation diffusion facilitator family transporter [Candidatus Methanoperedens nitroreducens]CAG0985667.1 Ferrous-iron efflux pump FieF [Methanosarcinales archaeon]MCX9077055.1 cation diffusion facilitator family transporter [Candidatus Methanopered
MPDKNNKYFAAHKEITSVARLSIYSNSLLLIIKLAVGFFMGSISVMSEALHSGIDLLAAVIANYSVKKAGQPADDEHRFGHGKFENVSGTVEAILIFVVAIIILYKSSVKILGNETIEIDSSLIGIGIVIMGISTIVNFYVSARIMKVAKKAESIALEADAYHLTTDVYTSVGVLAGLILIRVTGNPVFDPLMAIIVALIILKASYDLTKRSVSGIMDVKLSDNEEDAIKSIIHEHYSQYAEYHNLRSRMSGAERFVDLHLVVPKNQNVVDAHDFCDHLEKEIKEKIPNLSILIHVEPCRTDCEICQKLDVCTKPDIVR